jgi:ferritin-like protein
MPLDLTAEDLVPENLNFPVVYEPTKFSERKYVINGNTGDYIGIVGNSFNCASHGDFFMRVHDAITENLGEDQCDSMNIKYKTARNNAWALMDMTLPNVIARVENSKHTTTIAQRIIALHGIDGSCSNQVYFGAIDFFCTNGIITGEYGEIKRKNSALFCIEKFGEELQKSSNDFYEQSETLQSWANTPMPSYNVKELLQRIIKSDRKAEKMYSLYSQETAVRGNNIFALYSAFTNYASYADERNGFNLRNTGKDTVSQSMWSREQEVAKWISTDAFKNLVAA